MSFFQVLKKNMITEALFLCGIGLVLILWPGTSMNTICILVGVMLIAAGIGSLIGYCTKDDMTRYFSNDLVQGLLLLVFGMLVIVMRDKIIIIIPLMIGLVAIFSGCVKIQEALNLYFTGVGGWIWIILLALVNIGVGIYLITRPGRAVEQLTILMGVLLLYSGVTDLLTTMVAAHKLKKIFPADRVINGTYKEIDDEDETE